jgi:GNAT superfamily N-acetyltransferase
MRKEDWGAFTEIDQVIFPDDRIEQEQSFIDRVEQGNFFALDVDGKLAGYLIVARFGENGAHLGRIGVIKERQRQGLGTLLMKHALKWFREQGGIAYALLYTQHDNHPAQQLYRQFGFKISGVTWSFYVPFHTLTPIHRYSCQPIQTEEIAAVGTQYEATLPAASIHRFLERGHLVHTLKDVEGQIVGACRFTPQFPGCFPFEIDHLDCFDDFIHGLRPWSLPEFNYMRVTFTENPALAKLLEERQYKLHHKLFQMRVELD